MVSCNEFYYLETRVRHIDDAWVVCRTKAIWKRCPPGSTNDYKWGYGLVFLVLSNFTISTPVRSVVKSANRKSSLLNIKGKLIVIDGCVLVPGQRLRHSQPKKLKLFQNGFRHSGKLANKYSLSYFRLWIITVRKRSLGQGNIFTSVCHSFSPQRGWSASGVCIVGVGQTPPSDTTGYGQRAGGMHPTGMHSCFILKLQWIWACLILN